MVQCEFDTTSGSFFVAQQTFDYIFGLVDTYFDDVAISPNSESQCECKLKFKT